MRAPKDAEVFLPGVFALDLEICKWLNQGHQRQRIAGLCRGVSRLGDGVLWYALFLALPLVFGMSAVPAMLELLVTSVLSLTLYRWIKRKTGRARPYQRHQGVVVRIGRALDDFSFPSGHTLHAVAFSAIAVAHFPILAWALVPFSILTALSRVVLGLHYPTDVLAGALLGSLIAGAVLLGPALFLR